MRWDQIVSKGNQKTTTTAHKKKKHREVRKKAHITFKNTSYTQIHKLEEIKFFFFKDLHFVPSKRDIFYVAGEAINHTAQ